MRAAGTLSYMAPEHLESIHTASTEKSDVYSFAIVVWVILTQEEPYASESGCLDARPLTKTEIALIKMKNHKLHFTSPLYVQTPEAKTRSASVSVTVIDPQRI